MATSLLAPCSDIIFFHTTIGGWHSRLTAVWGSSQRCGLPFFMFSTLTNFLILVYIFRLFQGSGGALGRRAVGGPFGDKGQFFPFESLETTIKSGFSTLWVWKTCRKTTHFALSAPRSKTAKCCDFIALRYVFRSKDRKTSFFYSANSSSPSIVYFS